MQKKNILENETEINDVSVWHILAVLGQKGQILLYFCINLFVCFVFRLYLTIIVITVSRLMLFLAVVAVAAISNSR